MHAPWHATQTDEKMTPSVDRHPLKIFKLHGLINALQDPSPRRVSRSDCKQLPVEFINLTIHNEGAYYIDISCLDTWM